jgi:restriction endonuclease EcoRII-like protein
MSSGDLPKAISKTLSPNDTGETGGHQAGILVPKEATILSFFPPLDPSVRNPRHHLVFYDDAGNRWEFAFIYYNNKFFGGTRNEYRLTRMTDFIRRHNLKPGDEIVLARQEAARRVVSYKRANVATRTASGVLKLGTTWKVIKI